ncbi:hypothetical protein GCM10027097_55240 [Amycolatopsis acidiphila]
MGIGVMVHMGTSSVKETALDDARAVRVPDARAAAGLPFSRVCWGTDHPAGGRPTVSLPKLALVIDRPASREPRRRGQES